MTTVTSAGAPEFPSVAGTIMPTDQEAMDGAIQVLNARKDAWVALGVAAAGTLHCAGGVARMNQFQSR